MKYFIKAEFIDPGTLYHPEKFVGLVESIVAPYFDDMLSKMEVENKILDAGIVPGTRAGIFIVDAKSDDGLTELLESSPFYGLLKLEMTPMESVKDRTMIEKKMVENLKNQCK